MKHVFKCKNCLKEFDTFMEIITTHYEKEHKADLEYLQNQYEECTNKLNDLQLEHPEMKIKLEPIINWEKYLDVIEVKIDNKKTNTN